MDSKTFRIKRKYIQMQDRIWLLKEQCVTIRGIYWHKWNIVLINIRVVNRLKY